MVYYFSNALKILNIRRLKKKLVKLYEEAAYAKINIFYRKPWS